MGDTALNDCCYCELDNSMKITSSSSSSFTVDILKTDQKKKRKITSPSEEERKHRQLLMSQRISTLESVKNKNDVITNTACTTRINILLEQLHDKNMELDNLNSSIIDMENESDYDDNSVQYNEQKQLKRIKSKRKLLKKQISFIELEYSTLKQNIGYESSSDSD